MEIILKTFSQFDFRLIDDFSAKLLEFNKRSHNRNTTPLTCVINATRVRHFYNASCIIVSWTWFDIRRQWINMTNGRITKTKKNRSIIRSHYKKKKEKESRACLQLATITETSTLNFRIDRSENIREKKRYAPFTKRIVYIILLSIKIKLVLFFIYIYICTYRRKIEGKLI